MFVIKVVRITMIHCGSRSLLASTHPCTSNLRYEQNYYNLKLFHRIVQTLSLIDNKLKKVTKKEKT